MNKEELLYNEIYERTKDFGRTQFVREIMNLQRENKELKDKVNQLEEDYKNEVEENLKLSEVWAKFQEEKRHLETNIEEAINIIKNHIDCEETLDGMLRFPTKKIIDVLER